jgi:cell division control protein 6
MAKLDQKTGSVFNPVKVHFPPYSRKEAHDILATRVTYGLYDGVLSEELLDYAVEKTVAAGDMRVGIDLIRRSTLLAEKDASRKITKDHMETAYERESKNISLKRTIEALDATEKALLSLIAEEDGLKSGELQERLNKKTGTGIKKYNEMIAKLEHIGLIETIPVPGRGQSREIRLKGSKKDVESCL